VVTDTRSWRVAYLDCWTTRDELIDACMASAHVPWFFDLRPAAQYRRGLNTRRTRFHSVRRGCLPLLACMRSPRTGVTCSRHARMDGLC